MILPTKHLRADRTLLSVGGEIHSIIDEPKTVSRVWEEFSTSRIRAEGRAPVSYDWFVLSLDLLFMLGAVAFEDGRLLRTPR